MPSVLVMVTRGLKKGQMQTRYFKTEQEKNEAIKRMNERILKMNRPKKMRNK